MMGIKHMSIRPVTRALAGALFLLGVAISGAAAQDAREFVPGTSYDEAVPTLEKVVGHRFGERITSPEDAISYMEALARANPERMKLVTYAQSWEGRPLVYAIVSSPENISRLDDIQAGMQSLADPRVTNRAAATALIANLPGVAWMTYGVHGNEISSTDAALFLTWHLLAARGDALVDEILEKTVVLIDPMQNPDGRARFVHNFEIAEGLEPDADRLAAEHREPWPGGRTNHYFFDMNRDWFALTQPETKGRIRTYLDWYPVAVIDAHEMNGDSSYYFAPPAEPFNPNITKTQRDGLELIGRNNAKWFDKYGFDYFTREVFDAFYPGYGDMWPTLHGAIATTYEQASSRGLLWRKDDGRVLTYSDTVRRHVTSSIATLETVATHRAKLLSDFHDYRRTAIEEGRAERNRVYLLDHIEDPAGAEKLAHILEAQGIDVHTAATGFKSCGKAFEQGTFVINAAQPSKRLIRSLLEVDVPISKTFMAEQERRRAKQLPNELYDVTAWSLPLMYGVKMTTCKAMPDVSLVVSGDRQTAASMTGASEAAVAWIASWRDASSVRLLTGALRAGLTVKSADRSFETGGTEYPAGSLIFPAAENDDDLAVELEALSRTSGAPVTGVTSSWIDSGPNFGSDNVHPVPELKVALAWDTGVSPNSAGNTRFVIERQFGYPVSVIRTLTLSTADLSRYDVLILPEQDFVGYNRTLGETGSKNLAEWVEEGGVLIGLGSAMQYMSDPAVNLVSVRREFAVRDEESVKEAGDGEDKSHVAGQVIKDLATYKALVTPEEMRPDTVPGVLVRAEADPDHWISSGLRTMNVLLSGRDVYTPLTRDKGVNAVRFASADNLLVSGYLWEESRTQIAFKPFVVVEPRGQGMVIGFTSSPTTRAYLDGLNMIFMNAVLRAPAHSRKLR